MCYMYECRILRKLIPRQAAFAVFAGGGLEMAYRRRCPKDSRSETTISSALVRDEASTVLSETARRKQATGDDTLHLKQKVLPYPHHSW